MAHHPNPCVAPIDAGPFYAVKIVAGSLGISPLCPPPGYEILICFDRGSVLKFQRDVAGHGVVDTRTPAG